MRVNRIVITLFAYSALLLSSCGGGQSGSQDAEVKELDPSDPLSNKGIGPVTNVDLQEEINTLMATEGKLIYNQYCTACHKPEEKYIGPPQKGILGRRSPEWVMNFIINPAEMLEKDPIAIALLEEYNGAIMTDMNLDEDQARKILEYIRTL